MAGFGESEIESCPSFGQLQREQSERFIQNKKDKHDKEKVRPRFVN